MRYRKKWLTVNACLYEDFSLFGPTSYQKPIMIHNVTELYEIESCISPIIYCSQININSLW